MNKFEQKIEARTTVPQVWKAWEKIHSETGIVEGKSGEVKKIKYRFREVEAGRGYTIEWKTYLTRLIFTHSAQPSKRGVEIVYTAEVRGLFAWPIRWLLGRKIEHNLGLVLRALVRSLEG
jgi:hypothetical protein